MKNLVILILLVLLSLILGFIKYQGIYNNKEKKLHSDLHDGKDENWEWQRKFIETWNGFINFLIPGLIGYYFVSVRWPLLRDGQNPSTADFILLTVFILGLFGHLSVMSYNITRGVEAIFDRVLRRG